MRGLLVVAVGLAMLGAGQAMAQSPAGAQGEPACKPCWIEPWYCKGPPCPPKPGPPRPPSEPDAEPPRPHLVHISLTGTVISFGIVQEEPAETPQATFFLDVVGSDGVRRKVLVVVPAPAFHCWEGERATLEGEVGPDEAKAPTILLDARLVSCG